MSSSGGPAPSVRAIFRGRRGTLLAAYLVTEFAASVSGLSYSAVLPVAADELDGLALYAPAVTATGVVSIATAGLGAFLYGRVGPRRQLWLATVVWLAGAALTAAAPSMEVLVAGMAVRGLSGGLLAGLGMGVIGGLYPEPRERERALGFFALMWLLPSLVGPVVNGLLLVTLGWRASMAWPALLLLAGRVLVSRSLDVVAWERDERPAGVRGAGAFLAVAVGLVAVQAALVAGGPWVAAAPAGAALVLLVPFRRALRATVPGAVRAQAGGWVLLLVCAGYFGLNALVPLLAGRFLDASGVLGAVLVSVGPLTWAVVSGTGLGARTSTRTALVLAVTGFPLAAAVVAAWSAADGAGGVALLVVAALAMGLAMGVVYPKVMTLTFVGFREEGGTTRAHGGVVLGLSEDVGTAVGATVLAGVAALAVTSGPGPVAVLAGAAAAALLLAWLVAVRSPLWPRPVTTAGPLDASTQ